MGGSKTTKPYLIVGQGLAGTTLALELFNRGITFKVLDQGHINSSSMVAAGMWNPLVFKRLTKSWKTDVLVPSLNTVYKRSEAVLKSKFLHHLPVLRLFDNAGQQNDWEARSAEPAFAPFFDGKTTPELKGIKLKFEGGYGLVAQSGYVNLKEYLKSAKNWLKEAGNLIESAVAYDELIEHPEGRIYKGEVYAGVIFTEGYQMKLNNPFFKYLPLQHTKGQILQVQAEKIDLNCIVNKGVFLVPQNNAYTLGSTYEWNNPTLDTTEEAKEHLLKEVSNYLADKPIVLEHKAGIRPTVIDRRPLVGEHPTEKDLFVLNGLGTKGVMLAPWLASELANHIGSKEPLNKEIDIKRFEKKYFEN